MGISHHTNNLNCSQAFRVIEIKYWLPARAIMAHLGQIFMELAIKIRIFFAQRSSSILLSINCPI
jgi:hypothetical protein